MERLTRRKKREQVTLKMNAFDLKKEVIGPIAILCHWHVGSSCLSKIFAACGMEVGNEKTYWDEDCINSCEHSLFNRIGDNLYRESVNVDILRQARYILRSYKEQAKENNWNHYGLKCTHALQSNCWNHLKSIFEEEWPDAQYVIGIRHPSEIVASTNDPEWSDKRIVDSWMSCGDATLELISNEATVVVFPESYLNGHINKVVKRLGLIWNIKADEIFTGDLVTSKRDESGEFERKFPEAAAKYNEILRELINHV